MTQHDYRPQHIQVAAGLRERITSGDLGPGEKLPSEPELAARYGVSRTTVRHAIDVIRGEGLIRTEKGRGTFVRIPRHPVRRDHTARYEWEKERALLTPIERGETGATEHDTGLEMGDLMFTAAYEHRVPAPADVAARFGVPEGTAMLRRTYATSVREAKDVPLNIVTSWLRYGVVVGNPDLLDDGNEPWPGGTMHQLRTVGIEIDAITDEITARPASGDEKDLLDLDDGESVLVLRKTSIDTAGQVAEYSEVILPGDRTVFAYTTQLQRWPAP